VSKHVSALDLDRLALDALAEPDLARVRDHLAGCARCRADDKAARELRDHFASRVLPRGLPARKSRWTWWIAAPALAAAAVVLVVIARPRDGDEITIKGEAAWQIYASRGDKQFRVRDGTVLAAGDRIRFVVTPSGAPYLMIASVDGTGSASIYYPYDGTKSARIASDRTTELEGSIVLDAAPGPERVFAIFSSEPLAADAIRQKLADLGALGQSVIRKTRKLDVVVRGQLSVVFEKEHR
jgi:hypothetical protein